MEDIGLRSGALYNRIQPEILLQRARPIKTTLIIELF